MIKRIFMSGNGGLVCRYSPISGFHGVVAGFLVAMKQIMPDQDSGVFKLHVKVKFVFYVVLLLWCKIESHLCMADNARLFS